MSKIVLSLIALALVIVVCFFVERARRAEVCSCHDQNCQNVEQVNDIRRQLSELSSNAEIAHRLHSLRADSATSRSTKCILQEMKASGDAPKVLLANNVELFFE